MLFFPSLTQSIITELIVLYGLWYCDWDEVISNIDILVKNHYCSFYSLCCSFTKVSFCTKGVLYNLFFNGTTLELVKRHLIVYRIIVNYFLERFELSITGRHWHTRFIMFGELRLIWGNVCCGVLCSLHKQTDGQTSAFLFTSPIHQSMVSVGLRVLLTFWICRTLPIDKCVSRVVKVPVLTNNVCCLSRNTQN